MPKWDEMTEEEREAYINQDVVERGGYELLEGDFGNEYFDPDQQHLILADVGLTAPDSLRETIEELFRDDPYTLSCAYGHWIMGMKVREIADELTVIYRCGDQEYIDKGKSINAINKVIQRARRQLVAVGLKIGKKNGQMSTCVH